MTVALNFIQLLILKCTWVFLLLTLAAQDLKASDSVKYKLARHYYIVGSLYILILVMSGSAVLT